ncbi:MULTISPECIES: nucleotidyl transferase AbiEii/AbiGii toxin family protein [Gammaproteobacteria]|uniref:nucleotidyl transferase AbiEii/AbiGii toxin family protein n=1 Tax=Gammaproteobacteria TaxID=1236 RepID=UPI000DCFC9CD|nr:MULTISPECIES: nucleotidyl transferase AbiEii/AbiGii toxin family protein [Gammaproteobacteria]RTE86572.1 nucleotidyl transferase AbiEii/AbiGii toxin family protein [Aliidiomarina sp. B3213]TCZ90873.1 nucleotidyl transferase AbiEii/AbiGii toxin family protein [Lysobacter sp. N42]
MVKNIAVSVRQRLMNVARKRKENFNFVLTRYGIERLLFRLSISPYANQFILKGATLFAIWNDEPHRPTRDVDFLGVCSNDINSIRATFTQVCEIEAEDGIVFDAQSIKIDEIKEDAEYSGVRVKLIGHIQRTQVNVQIDIGFNDVVVPEPLTQRVPALLDFPEPELLAYPVYSVIAEKLQAMYSLGEANSRMKDFYDLWTIITTQKLDTSLLKKAVLATFERRNTEFTSQAVIFESSFVNDEERLRMWNAYMNKLGISGIDFAEVVDSIQLLVIEISNILRKEMR